MLTHHHAASTFRLRTNNVSELQWTRGQLMRACAHGEVAGIAAVGLTVQFLLRDGISRGYLIRSDGSVQRFGNEQRAWAYIEQIRARVEHSTFSRAKIIKRDTREI